MSSKENLPNLGPQEFSSLCDVLGRIAAALEDRCKIERERLANEFPKVERGEVTIQTAKYPDPERDQPELAQGDEDLTEGMGPREAALVRKKLEKARLSKQERRSSKAPRA